MLTFVKIIQKEVGMSLLDFIAVILSIAVLTFIFVILFGFVNYFFDRFVGVDDDDKKSIRK
ncbi:MAG: hypothetical protein HQ536_03715 [Parcubacteria group bacterium]|nr:hypothetical protein [Parcubacteria group bacterium]